MRPTNRITKLTATAACGLALAMTLGLATARAEEDVPMDKKILRNVLEGLGLKRDGAAGINYQERAPLVIPPGRDLPPPEKGDAAIANNPAWPKDPDIARSQEAARLERNRNVTAEREAEENPLPPSKLTPGRAPKRQTPNGNSSYQAASGDFQNPLSPSQLGYSGGLFGNMFGGGKENEAVSFTGEPPRASLTAPPPGYQTPSPDQPYGAGKAAGPKAHDYYGTVGEVAR